MRTRFRIEVGVAEELKVLPVERFIVLHSLQESGIVHHLDADMTGAQETAGFAKIQPVLGDDGMRVAAGRMKISDNSPPHIAPNRPFPQVFEQRLALDETQRGLLQYRNLNPPEAVDGDQTHQTGVFIFPLLPYTRILEHPSGNQLFVGVIALQSALDAIRRFAHETPETDPIS